MRKFPWILLAVAGLFFATAPNAASGDIQAGAGGGSASNANYSTTSGYAQTANVANIALSGNATYALNANLCNYSLNANVCAYATAGGNVVYAQNSNLSAFAQSANVSNYAANANTSNYSGNSNLAAYAANSNIAAYASNAATSGYSSNSNLAVFAQSANVSNYSANSNVASYALNSNLASYAQNSNLASYASSAGTAVSTSGNAATATYAQSANICTYATTGGNVAYASNANLASYASNSNVSNYASNSNVSNYASNSNVATYATSAGAANMATNCTNAVNASTANACTSASNVVAGGNVITNASNANSYYAAVSGSNAAPAFATSNGPGLFSSSTCNVSLGIPTRTLPGLSINVGSTTTCNNDLIIGNASDASTQMNAENIIIGQNISQNCNTCVNTVNIGQNYGYGVVAASYGVAIGTNVNLQANNAVAIGIGATIPPNGVNSTCIGVNCVATDQNQVMLGTANQNVVSPGNFAANQNVNVGGKLNVAGNANIGGPLSFPNATVDTFGVSRPSVANPNSYYRVEEFDGYGNTLYGGYQNGSTQFGAGAVISALSASNMGVYSAFTSSATQGGSFMSGSGFLLVKSTAITYQWRILFYLPSLSTSTNRYVAYIGGGYNTSSSTNTFGGMYGGPYIKYSDNLNAGNWVLISSVTNTQTVTNSTLAAAQGWHRLVITLVNGTYTYVLDGTTMGTVTDTNLTASVSTGQLGSTCAAAMVPDGTNWTTAQYLTVDRADSYVSGLSR